MSEKTTILARQPTSTDKPEFSRRDFTKQRRRFASMFNRRERWLAKWKDIRDYQLPDLGVFDNEDDFSKQHAQHIYNGVAWEACQIFAAGVMSGLTPPSRQWFKLTMDSAQMAADSQVSRILDERQQILQAVLAKSNFYNAVFTCYMELPLGQAPMGIFTDRNTAVRYVPYTVGTYAMGSDSTGKITSFARKYRMTAEQIVEQFGAESCPNYIRAAAESANTQTKTYIVNWLVEVNPDSDRLKLGNQHMPYTSTYWVAGQSNIECLYSGGFMDWPVPVARYNVRELEPYGKGPAWYAQSDCKMLQKLEYDLLVAIELAVKPPMQVPANFAGEVNLFPGGITENDSNELVKPVFDVRIDAQALQAKIQDVESRIKRYYAADLFLMLDQLDKGQMTAREVMERTQEKLQQLGPVVERLLSEFLNPIIERTYAILERSGVFSPLPDELAQELAEQDVKIEYISPLAQAQKMSSLVNIEQFWAFVMTLAQADPSILQKFDMVQAVNIYANNLGAPAPILRSDDEYQQIIQQIQQAQQEQQEAAEQQQGLDQLGQLASAAKVSAEAARDGNPAMQEWLGLGGGT